MRKELRKDIAKAVISQHLLMIDSYAFDNARHLVSHLEVEQIIDEIKEISHKMSLQICEKYNLDAVGDVVENIVESILYETA